MLSQKMRRLLPVMVVLGVLVAGLLGQHVLIAVTGQGQSVLGRLVGNGKDLGEVTGMAGEEEVGVGQDGGHASVVHVPTPAFVKGIYMNAGTAMGGPVRDEIMKLLKTTELNTVVIDIKDDYGRIAYPARDPELAPYLGETIMMSNIDELLAELHEAGIYVIARLFVFQDRALVDRRPDLAVQSTLGGVWKDYKGVSWIDASAEEAWEYNARIARDAYARGFDEIQFDYIRFPSDGNMKTVKYTHFDASKETRTEVMTRFFQYMDKEVRQKGIPTSADLFGFAYWYRDEDLTIGQRIRDAAPYFTALSPMAYPSHYPSGTLGIDNPAEHPYEILAETMKRGNAIMAEWPEVEWSSRPWLQAFNIGAIYDAAKYKAQMKAVEDHGGDGWLFWNARNVYTAGAFAAKE